MIRDLRSLYYKKLMIGDIGKLIVKEGKIYDLEKV